MLHFLIPVWYSAALTYFSWHGCWDNPIFQLSCILFFLSYLPQPSPSLWKHLMVIFFFLWNDFENDLEQMRGDLLSFAKICNWHCWVLQRQICWQMLQWQPFFFFLSRYLLLLIFTWVLCRYFFFVVILVLDWWVTLLVMQSLKRSC